MIFLYALTLHQNEVKKKKQRKLVTRNWRRVSIVYFQDSARIFLLAFYGSPRVITFPPLLVRSATKAKIKFLPEYEFMAFLCAALTEWRYCSFRPRYSSRFSLSSMGFFCFGLIIISSLSSAGIEWNSSWKWLLKSRSKTKKR